MTEKHVKILLQNLSDNKPHDCLDQVDRFVLDVVSDVFFGQSANTLSTELQPLRDAVEKMYVWNTNKILIGRLGALLPGNSKASDVVVNYLDHVIDQAMTWRDESKSMVAERKEHTLIGSLIAQNISRKASPPFKGNFLTCQGSAKDSPCLANKGRHDGNLDRRQSQSAISPRPHTLRRTQLLTIHLRTLAQ